MSNIDNDADPQDRAEVLDETNLTADGRNIANFDEVSDVYDATSAADDSDIDDLDPEREDEDFQAAEFDDGDLTEDRDDTGLRAAPEDRSFAFDEDRVGTDQERSRNYEASGGTGDEEDATQVDPGEAAPDEKDEHVDKQLDKGLKETFPASDPVSINPGAD
ncbi:MAG TPA: primosomal protein [Caulobacter sp.]|nr:primosomal protein [Caulobacter sp.]